MHLASGVVAPPNRYDPSGRARGAAIIAGPAPIIVRPRMDTTPPGTNYDVSAAIAPDPYNRKLETAYDIKSDINRWFS